LSDLCCIFITAMIHIIRTNSDNFDFQELVKQLDKELATVDGQDHSFYSQFNKIDKIRHVLVAYQNGKPVGCGAICVLETGKRQPDAIRLYVKNGYKAIPNWGQYIGVENSVCFEKKL
jgi:putative acetyltransferase